MVKNSPGNVGDTGDAGSIPGPGGSPGGGPRQSAPVFLPRESHGQRSLVDYGTEGRGELNMTELT